MKVANAMPAVRSRRTSRLTMAFLLLDQVDLREFV